VSAAETGEVFEEVEDALSPAVSTIWKDIMVTDNCAGVSGFDQLPEMPAC